MILKPARGTPLNLSHPHSRGLIADYLMNEGMGDEVFDHSRNGNEGVIAGATWAHGRTGPALSLNGSTNYLGLPPLWPSGVQSTGTILIWFNSFDVGPASGIKTLVQKLKVAGTDSFRLILSNNKVNVRLDEADPTNITGATTISPFTWYLAGFMWDSTITKLVIISQQGIEEASGAAGSNTLPGSAFNTWVGRYEFQVSAFIGYFKGLLDNPIIYNRPLPTVEFMQHHFNTYARYERPSPARYFFVPTAPPSYIPYPRLSGMGGGISEGMQGGLSV